MGRKLVWLATVAVAASVLFAGIASAQYRGYGDGYGGAPDYYQGGPGGGDGYGAYSYGDPGYGAPPRRYRQYQSYDYDQPPPRGPYADPRGAYAAPPPADRDRRATYGDPQGYDGGGYGQGPAPQPTYAYPNNNGGDPDHKASDVDLREGSQEATRTEVENPTKQPPGTIVIDTASRHLYLVEKNGQAIQYGIGVGREGFAWKGVAHVQRKSEWPDWIPPSDMLKRRPDLPTRMAGGIENPLGARAMYLFQGNKDTMFRIHGTNEPDSIGKAMSSGCIRMMNNDVIDLYSRIPVGTKVVVL